MDLTRRGNLEEGEKFEVAQRLQMILLDEIAREARWSRGDVALHGGTCFNTVWRSDRWSEDIDFMLSKDRRESLDDISRSVVIAVRSRMSAHYPACIIEFSVKPGKQDAEDCIDTWLIKWSHPNRIGKSIVKVEFYASEPQVLLAYKTMLFRPERDGVRVSVVMPVAELLSLWADKTKAIATRGGLKWRDIHDLAYVAESMDARRWPLPGELMDAIETTASIYGKTPSDVLEGLGQRLDNGSIADIDAFILDMRRWYPKEIYEDYVSRGMFAQLHSRAISECRRAVDIISAESALTEHSEPAP